MEIETSGLGHGRVLRLPNGFVRMSRVVGIDVTVTGVVRFHVDGAGSTPFSLKLPMGDKLEERTATLVAELRERFEQHWFKYP